MTLIVSLQNIPLLRILICIFLVITLWPRDRKVTATDPWQVTQIMHIHNNYCYLSVALLTSFSLS